MREEEVHFVALDIQQILLHVNKMEWCPQVEVNLYVR